jgi:putative tryptophan/tyrosine transport system substrate-binding protein
MGWSWRRREFIALTGGTALSLSFGARAQQAPMPVVGFLGSATPEGYANVVAVINEGLSQAGYVEGKNLAIEYRWARHQYNRLPDLAAELVRRQVAVIITTGGNAPVLAAKAATSTIPIVFATGADPVQSGLVPKLSGSDANITGVTFFHNALMPKRLEIMREVLPGARVFAMLMNSKAANVEADRKEILAAASIMGVELFILYAAGDREPESAFMEHAHSRLWHKA